MKELLPLLMGEEARVIASYLNEDDWAEAESIIGKDRCDEIRESVEEFGHNE